MKYPYQTQRYLPDLHQPWYPCMNHELLADAIHLAYLYDCARVVNLETKEVVWPETVLV